MVWSNIPGANIHRGAEADNTERRTVQAGVKRSTYPSVFSASVQAVPPGIRSPGGVAFRSQRCMPHLAFCLCHMPSLSCACPLIQT